MGNCDMNAVMPFLEQSWTHLLLLRARHWSKTESCPSIHYIDKMTCNTPLDSVERKGATATIARVLSYKYHTQHNLRANLLLKIKNGTGKLHKHKVFRGSYWLQSLEKTLMLGKCDGKRRRGQQRMRWLDSVIEATNMNLTGRQWKTGGPGVLWSKGSRRVGHKTTKQQQSLL